MRVLDRWKERQQDERIKRHADILASTARMEMELDIGDWRQTVANMNELLATLHHTFTEHKSEVELLVTQMRRQISHLEQALHRREAEYDRLQEQVCRQKDDAFQAGYDAATDYYARGGSFK